MLQVQALSEDDYTKIPQWSEPVLLNLTHLLSAFRTVPLAKPINLTYPQVVLTTEGSVFYLRFSIEGQALDGIPFSLLPLTYQQFETLSGQRVADIFSDVPTAASFS